MTRDEQVQKLRSGESVFVQFPDGVRLVTQEAHLPSEADMAALSGDPERKQRSAKDIDREIARLQAEKTKVESSDPASADPKKVK